MPRRRRRLIVGSGGISVPATGPFADTTAITADDTTNTADSF